MKFFAVLLLNMLVYLLRMIHSFGYSCSFQRSVKREGNTSLKKLQYFWLNLCERQIPLLGQRNI